MVTSENTQNNPQTPLSTLFGLIKRVRDDSLLRNSLFIMLTSGIGSATGYLYWVIAARTYSASDVGLVSAIISAMTLTSILSILGFGSTIVQNLPHRAAGRDWSATVNTALVAASVTSLLGGVVAVTILISSPQFGTMANNTAYLAAFLFSIPLWTASTLVDAVFTAERVTGNMLVRNLIFSILKIVLLASSSGQPVSTRRATGSAPCRRSRRSSPPRSSPSWGRTISTAWPVDVGPPRVARAPRPGSGPVP